MKQLICLFSIALLVTCSTGGSSSLEKVISGYRQTDTKTGKLYDLHLKTIEMGESQKITVADSLKILEADFQAENGKTIENYNTLLSMVKKNKTTSCRVQP